MIRENQRSVELFLRLSYDSVIFPSYHQDVDLATEIFRNLDSDLKLSLTRSTSGYYHYC